MLNDEKTWQNLKVAWFAGNDYNVVKTVELV